MKNESFHFSHFPQMLEPLKLWLNLKDSNTSYKAISNSSPKIFNDTLGILWNVFFPPFSETGRPRSVPHLVLQFNFPLASFLSQFLTKTFLIELEPILPCLKSCQTYLLKGTGKPFCSIY